MSFCKNTICLLRDSILEQHGKDNPFSVRTARILRCGVWLAAFSSLFSILIYESEFTDITYHGGFQPIRQQSFVLLKSLVHSFYLYLTFSILVFSQPLERLFLQQLILPTILLFAQVFYVLSNAFPTHPLLHDVSYGLFMALFLLWAVRDWGERGNPNRQKTEIYWWLGVEGLALMIFFVFLFVPDSKVRYFHLAPKDVAVGLSVALWGITRVFQNFVKDENYVTVYQRFKEEFLPVAAPSIPPLIQRPIENVFDFGGGDGERLEQILSWLKISPKFVLCYEKDERWREEFERRCPHWEFLVRDFSVPLPKDRISQIDLFVFSHVLYEEGNISEIADLLKHAKPGAIVLFRGNGPNSIFVAISFIKSRSMLSNNRSHIWIDVFLKRLVQQARLKRLDAGKKDFEPDVVVPQWYPINAKGRITTFLRYLYDDQRGDIDILDRFAGQIETIQNVKALPCDDVLFIYETPTP